MQNIFALLNNYIFSTEEKMKSKERGVYVSGGFSFFSLMILTEIKLEKEVDPLMFWWRKTRKEFQ